MRTEEINIIAGLQNGNEETYILLFREYYVSLCAYSRKYVGRKDVAEEIVSEVFFKIWENRKTLRITTSVKAYLFQAVCNNSLYYLRKLKKEENIEAYFSDTDFENIGFATSPDEEKEASILLEDMTERIEEVVNQLPRQQQIAFRLKRFEGKKNKEVAEEMGISIKTVEMHLSKAMFTLRHQLKDYLPTFLLFILFK
jgi:RNA polymerase sigma-70 factor (ECF subfamily)